LSSDGLSLFGGRLMLSDKGETAGEAEEENSPSLKAN
jgi:hypothetical protein